MSKFYIGLHTHRHGVSSYLFTVKGGKVLGSRTSFASLAMTTRKIVRTSS